MPYSRSKSSEIPLYRPAAWGIKKAEAGSERLLRHCCAVCDCPPQYNHAALISLFVLHFWQRCGSHFVAAAEPEHMCKTLLSQFRWNFGIKVLSDFDNALENALGVSTVRFFSVALRPRLNPFVRACYEYLVPVHVADHVCRTVRASTP